MTKNEKIEKVKKIKSKIEKYENEKEEIKEDLDILRKNKIRIDEKYYKDVYSYYEKQIDYLDCLIGSYKNIMEYYIR